jgi:hypothetical protein
LNVAFEKQNLVRPFSPALGAQRLPKQEAEKGE